MGELLQHAFVTIVALGASVVVVRRVLGFVAPAQTPGCSSCPSAKTTCGPAPTPAGAVEHPMVLVRGPRSNRHA